MNAPIYFQPISNGGDRGDEKGRGADAVWLRALADLEHDDTAVAVVYAPGPPAPAPTTLTLIPTQVDALDGDDCEASLCVYRRHAIEVQRVHGLAAKVTE